MLSTEYEFGLKVVAEDVAIAVVAGTAVVERVQLPRFGTLNFQLAQRLRCLYDPLPINEKSDILFLISNYSS